MPKLILSIDGGGIRGAASAYFLSKIESQLKNTHGISLRDCVDFYAGTSTGSIIALALATTKLSVEAISDLYSYQTAGIIFTKNNHWFDVDGINAPKYEASGKTQVLKQSMGNAKLGDVPDNKHVLAVSYAIEKRQPEVFKSTNPSYHNLLSYQVADASSAAPTYFPTKELSLGESKDEHWLIDGGVTANNPTMCAIAEARRVWKDVPFDDLRVLSIGTGYRTRKINGPESQHWGKLGWVTKGEILDILTGEQITAYQAINITKSGNYIRVNAEMKPQPGLLEPPDDAMDDISHKNINALKAMGDFWFEQYGQHVVELLLGTYTGASLDRINPTTGIPIQY